MGDQREPPVHGEQVNEGGHRGHDGGGDLQRGVRHQVVQRRYVVPGGLLDLAGAVLGEPAERQPPEVAGDASAQAELEVGVRVVGEGARDGVQHQPRHQGGHGSPGRRPGAALVRPAGGEEGAGQFGDRDERDHRADRGGGLGHDRGEEPPAHGGEQATEAGRLPGALGFGGRCGGAGVIGIAVVAVVVLSRVRESRAGHENSWGTGRWEGACVVRSTAKSGASRVQWRPAAAASSASASMPIPDQGSGTVCSRRRVSRSRTR